LNPLRGYPASEAAGGPKAAAAKSIILAKNTPSVGLVIVVLLRKTWPISESLSGDNEAISVDGFRVPQHQKRVLVKHLLR
jgi:hypothetical protein